MSDIVDRLRAALDAKALVTDPDAMAPWLTDWRGRWTGEAAALVQPADEDELRTIVTFAAETRTPIVPQGGNSSMVGGATPDGSGTSLILSLRRMNATREIGARDVVVEAGCVLSTLQDALREKGLRLPLDLGARGSATIGGLASTNAGGTEVLRHGTMGALVIGLRAMLASGDVLDTLSPLKKDNRGPRLDRLFIGGEGQFGVITALRLACVRLPEHEVTAWAGLQSLEQAVGLLRFVEARLSPEGFEVVPQDSIEAAQATGDHRAPLEGQPWNALLHFDAPQAEVEEVLADAMEAGHADDVVVARSLAQGQAMWALRHALSDAEKRHYGMANSHDISVPTDAMPAFYDEAVATLQREWPGVSASGYGHLGDGNLHFHVRAMDRARDDWRETEGVDIERRVHDLVTRYGGSISAEHGIGQMKLGEFERLGEPARLEMLRAIKQALDPDAIFNPGKLIPR